MAPLRPVVLCGTHTVDRDAMVQQAGKAKNGQQLLQDLLNMEKTRSQEFLEHLENFASEYLSTLWFGGCKAITLQQ